MSPQPNSTSATPEGATFLSITEMARQLGVSRSTAREYLPDIPGVVRLGYRTVRIPSEGFRAWLRRMA